ncbi:hypothetical protein VNO77_25282 [Canavalia gladiata]|uniref:Fungal lipase-type domain-containing protein n=1 Tax=Canavalia gladiata TaxID=3824 RepID=A0AAN9QDC2_CANGL
MGRSSKMLYANKFMFFQPEKMGFFQLFKVLFGSELHNKDFVQFLGFIIVDERFYHKWLLFFSLLVQKFLHSIASLLKCIGDILESFLNPQAPNNYNVFMLVLNILRGQELVNKDSAHYVSIMGHLDKRVGFDNSIKREDPNKYNATLSIMASKVSYENKAFFQSIVVDRWKMELVDCRDYWNDYQEKATTQGFILLDKREEDDTYVVAFRGTEPFDADAWSTDIDFSWLELPNFGKTHAGFMKALGLQIELERNIVGWPKEIENDERPPRAYYAIRDLLKNRLEANNKANFIVTGHSLGGALAILFPAVLMLHDETFLLERLQGVYTFGQPRVGDKTFANYMKQNLKHYQIKYYRFVYCNDIVPRLPFDNKFMMFQHFGICLYYDRTYKGQKMVEEPNKNYFSWKETIPMRVNAFWELVRSFTIVHKYGAECQEGRLLKIFRLLGLLIPGLPAHITQDYVNVTQLGFFSHLD